jgi:multiple antibiotic resistance protein
MHRRDDYPERSGVGATGFADLEAHGGIRLAVAALSAVVSVGYGFAPMIAARIKPETAHGVQRVIAFVLLSIRVQIT